MKERNSTHPFTPTKEEKMMLLFLWAELVSLSKSAVRREKRASISITISKEHEIRAKKLNQSRKESIDDSTCNKLRSDERRMCERIGNCLLSISP